MKFWTKAFFSIAVLAFSFIIAEIVSSPERETEAIYFFDVGQGDAALIQKGDYQILIDGGPDDKVLAELAQVMPRTDRRIEVMILSHPHADHLTGLNAVLDRFEVGAIYGSGVIHTSSRYLEFLTKIKDRKLSFYIPQTGEELIPFENGQLTFLWPGELYQERTVENVNNASEVVRFCYLEKCALFMGDLETDGQDQMLAAYEGKTTVFNAEILKYPHHGSNNGLNRKLIEMIGVKFVILSAGKDNQYGHPHQAVIDFFQEKGTTIFRTDQAGTVKLPLYN